MVIVAMDQVGRFRQPDKVSTQLGTAGTMQCVILPVDLLFKNGAVLIVRWKDHAPAIVAFPIFCLDQPNAHAKRRHHGVGEIKETINFRYATILDAIRFQLIFPENGMIVLRLVKYFSIRAANQPEVGECGELIFSTVAYNPWIRAIQVGIVLFKVENLDFAALIIYRNAEVTGLLHGALGHAQ